MSIANRLMSVFIKNIFNFLTARDRLTTGILFFMFSEIGFIKKKNHVFIKNKLVHYRYVNL
jgi:hypothetical protein